MSGFLCSMVGASFTVAAVAQVLRSKKGITAVGNAQVSTAQSKFGGASALFDGTGDYLSITDASFGTIGTGNFTIEGWVRPTGNISNHGIFMLSDTVLNSTVSGPALGFNSSQWNLYYGGADTRAGSVSTNTWYHFAIVRNGTSANNLQVYINGTSTITVTDNTNYSSRQGLGIGAYYNSSFAMAGYLDEFRISNSARYTTTFTPSTTAFVNDDNTLLLMHCNGTNATTFFEDDNGVRASRSLIAQGNAQIDTAQSKFGGSALLCDGTTDYLDTNTTNEFAFGTGQYTIEGWIRLNSTGKQHSFFDIRSAGSNDFILYVNSSNKLEIYNGSAGTGTTNLTTGVWYHVAVVRDSTNVKVYLNGTQETSVSASNMTGDRRLRIGGGRDGAGSPNTDLNGWMDEIRVSNIARYTAGFTAPTTPFVNDTNTLLLIHADGTDASTVFLDDNSGVPTVAPTTAVAFDGTNDYYESTGLTTTATDSKYLTIAFTWFHASGANSRNQNFMTARLGTANGENGWEVCLQSGRFRYSAPDNSGSDTDMVYGDGLHTNENAYNQMVAYIDHTSFANCKWYVNGVDRTSSLLNGSAIGAVNLANLNLNWGSSNVSIKIGEQLSAFAGTTGFSDFLGRISQIYVHNAAGAPDINKFWYFGSNRPRDLGTNGTATGLAQPLIYHYGNSTTFPTNNGTGFNSYTLTASGNIATGDGPNYA